MQNRCLARTIQLSQFNQCKQGQFNVCSKFVLQKLHCPHLVLYFILFIKANDLGVAYFTKFVFEFLGKTLVCVYSLHI